jgi:excinuclease ABC subunit A
MDDLIADGNSVVLVDHDTQVLLHADHLVEMGPEAGAGGGQVIAQGTVQELEHTPHSLIGPYLAEEQRLERASRTVRQQECRRLRPVIPEKELFDRGTLHLVTDRIHTVQPLDVRIPQGRLTVVTGVSGSGKTTMVLESLIPALTAHIQGTPLPAHVKSIQAEGIRQVKLIDATPIGINVRSTVATYAGVHAELRKAYARLALSREKGYRAGDFSYNTGKLRCPTCDGTGQITLDVQFLPRCGYSLPGLSRVPLWTGSVRTFTEGRGRKGIQPSGTDESERGPGAGSLWRSFPGTETTAGTP